MIGRSTSDRQMADAEQVLDSLVDEVTERLHAGQDVNIDDYARAHPDHADRLRRLFPTLQAMADIGHSIGGKETTMAAEHSTPRALGDFQIIRELGRGGMGVVYEADQLSIGRRVALKVLPFAALLDPQQLNRFKNEARAAGTLDHPNIVSVFSVGTERSVHFYAMQLIEGQSLAELIANLRKSQETTTGGPGADDRHTSVTEKAPLSPLAGAADRTEAREPAPEPGVSPSADTQRTPQAALSTVPTFDTQEYFRSVARLGVQAAQALDYAHKNGIVHRDVKPANLLINCENKLWITDFGLAHIESEASFTMTGDIVGTIRYMSPEQAQSPRAVIDHRTDIYSLGVTLYELLSLEPACRGTSRQELLRAIVEDEPIFPGRIVPRDLVTIVLKAMEKRPEDRYRTAQELADDLTRFLQDRPIRAKTPSPFARVTKWLRRRKRLVAAAALLLVLGSIGLAVSNLLLARERDQKDMALQAAQQMAQREKLSAAEAQLQQERAEANLIQALEATDQLLAGLADERMLDAPHVEPLRRKLAAEALDLCDELLKGNPQDPRVSRRSALARLQQGRIYQSLGEYAAAEEALRLSSGQLAQLVQQAEDANTRGQYEGSLIQSNLALGSLLDDLGQYEDSINVLRDAVALGKRLVDERPQSFLDHKTLVDGYNNLGVVLASLGQRDEALATHREAIDIGQQLVQDYPDEPEYRVALAQTYVNLGNIQEQPQASYDEAIRLALHALDSNPWSVLAKETLAKAHMQLATWHKRQGQLSEALDGYQQGTSIFESLAREHPLQLRYRAYLGGAYCNQGNAHLASRRQEEALGWYTRAVDTLESVLPQLARDAKAQEFIVFAHKNLGRALGKLDRDEEAIAAYGAAIEILREWAGERPAKYQQQLAELQHNRAHAMDASGTASRQAIRDQWQAVLDTQRQLTKNLSDQPDHAIQLADYLLCLSEFEHGASRESALVKEAITVLRSLPDSARQRAAWRETMARALGKLGGEANLKEAIEMFDQLVTEDANTPAYRLALADNSRILAVKLLRRDRFEEAETLLRTAIQLRKELVAAESRPLEMHSGLLFYPTSDLVEGLAFCQANLGYLFNNAGRPVACLEAYREAVATQTDVMQRWPSPQNFYKLLMYYRGVCELPCPDEQLEERLAWQREWLTAYEQFEGAFADELDPEDVCASKPCWQNLIAWILATCPDARLRDADRALELAQQAVLHAPEQGDFWSTLGTVQYRTGDWEESISSLETAMELRDGGNSFDWFFLAMSHWQLGQPDEARLWYDRAAEWMDEHKPNDKELQRFRAEAAALMEDNTSGRRP